MHPTFGRYNGHYKGLFVLFQLIISFGIITSVFSEIITPLLRHIMFDGLALQVGNPKKVHEETLDWIKQSSDMTKMWVVSIDEIGHHSVGIKPDADDYEHNEVRKDAFLSIIFWSLLFSRLARPGSVIAAAKGQEGPFP